MLHGALKGPVDTGARQILCNLASAAFTPSAHRGKPGAQRGVVLINTEAHDVYGLASPSDRHLDAGNESQPDCVSSTARLGNTVDFIMVGQCPQIDAVRFGALRQRGRREGTIRHDRVAVQICV